MLRCSDPNCGAPNPQGRDTCFRCGSPVVVVTKDTRAQKIGALALALVLILVGVVYQARVTRHKREVQAAAEAAARAAEERRQREIRDAAARQRELAEREAEDQARLQDPHFMTFLELTRGGLRGSGPSMYAGLSREERDREWDSYKENARDNTQRQRQRAADQGPQYPTLYAPGGTTVYYPKGAVTYPNASSPPPGAATPW